MSVYLPRKNVSIYYQNVRGLNTKLTISSCSYDFIALTETWLNDSVLDSELCNNNNYYTLRSDRDLTKMNLSRGGGVLLASRREFIFSTGFL
jgi:hypothetical protein